LDWGWADLALPPQSGMATATIGIAERRRNMTEGTFAISDDLAMPRAPRNNLPLLAVRFDLGDVTGTVVSRRAMLAYDDILAIEFLNRRLPAYWRRNGMTMAELLQLAERKKHRCGHAGKPSIMPWSPILRKPEAATMRSSPSSFIDKRSPLISWSQISMASPCSSQKKTSATVA